MSLPVNIRILTAERRMARITARFAIRAFAITAMDFGASLRVLLVLSLLATCLSVPGAARIFTGFGLGCCRLRLLGLVLRVLDPLIAAAAGF